MKKIILSVAVIALALGASAQKGSDEDSKPLKISVGVEAALPMSDFGKTYSFGIGASAQVDYRVAENLDITGNVGYISFSGKTVTTPSQTILGITIPGTSIKYPTLGYIPVLAGAKYHFSDNLYGSAQLGVTIASASGGGGSSSAFTYAPGIGYKFTENLDALLKYTGYSGKGGGSSSTVGLRVAYTF